MLFGVREGLEQSALVGALLTGALLATGAFGTHAALAMRSRARVGWLAGAGDGVNRVGTPAALGRTLALLGPDGRCPPRPERRGCETF